MSSHYSIGIFQTEKATEEENWSPMSSAEDAVEEVFDDMGEDTVVTSYFIEIPAPTENLDESFLTWRESDAFPDPPHPADDRKEYDYLLDWWRDYAEYQLDAGQTSSDSNVLLTYDADDIFGRAGAGTNSTFATAGKANWIANFEWDDDSGQSEFQDDSNPYRGTSTVIHEIGHNIIEYMDHEPDCFDDPSGAGHHVMGNASFYEDGGIIGSDDYAGTPMSRSGSYFPCMAEGGENLCGNEVTDDVDEVDASDLRYSDCSQNNIRDPL
ncbi:hypothetical protein [Halobiforma nitratireducens]|uniref:hypothetical protein n=1 Tax=Halobiforma nitratireducens TaxID=130048 RepID=UPI001267AE58|nr:hypothetical protein [Halobiforma nitratireducens]